ncbi:hypothetical protein QO206_13290 [Leeuwenhoekiella aequorea]|uniref:hypothetical protein n=1 Tax=Leeuwenhoekiella aequorea TaxID=283736 RepID=UPI00352DADDD|tara:strand:+ start:19684 stop:20295 length:612 start_codon:yes stop_codon:yes gene_type:complete
MILKLEYFENGRYKIPGAKATANGADRLVLITESLEAFEKRILIDGLGVVLYNEVLVALKDLENASQPLQDLIKGKNYEYNGMNVNWEGLQGSDSLLVSFAYSQWVLEAQDILTTFGTQQPEAINSTEVSAQPRFASAYNEFFNKYQGVEELPRVIHRSAGVGIDWYGSRKPNRTLMQFLQENAIDYPDAVFTMKEPVNSWGI